MLAFRVHKLELVVETYYLVWQRDDPEVNELYNRPKHEVGFESRQIHVLELSRHGTASTAFCNGHESEEACETY